METGIAVRLQKPSKPVKTQKNSKGFYGVCTTKSASFAAKIAKIECITMESLKTANNCFVFVKVRRTLT